MTGLNIDIVKILLLWNDLSLYKNDFESSQEGTFKFANPKHEHRTERQSGRLSQLSLNFLDCRAEMCIHLYEEFMCQYKFQLSFSFSRQNIKSLKQSSGDLCVLILSLVLMMKLCSTSLY